MDKPLPLRKLRCKHCNAKVTDFITQTTGWEDMEDMEDVEKDIRLASNFHLTFSCGRTVEHDPDWPRPRDTAPCGG